MPRLFDILIKFGYQTTNNKFCSYCY